MTVPLGFIDLYAASSRINEQINIMGVVTDVLPPSKSGGSDWMCTFSIADSTIGNYDQALKVRFFNVESELPKLQGTGDVVILRSIKITQWSGMTMAISSYRTTWIVFPENSIPKKSLFNPQLKYVKQAGSSVPSTAEMQYAVLLCNSKDRDSCVKVSIATSHISDGSGTQTTTDQHVSTQKRREKFSLIKDVQPQNFYDLVGQVIKIYPSNGRVELYITDYTSNQELFNYEWGFPIGEDRDVDEFGYIRRSSTNRQWPGPFGQLTLVITLWPPHSYYAQTNVKEMDFVFLRNVRIRKNNDFKTEGAMHTDQKHGDRIDVIILTDRKDNEHVKDVLRRKRIYAEKFKAQSQNFIDEVRLQKRKQEDEKPLSKKQKKKQKLQNSKLNNRENENTNQDSVKNPEILPLIKSGESNLNNNIQCSHSSFPPRSLSSILSFESHAYKTPNGTACTLPFQNIKSRAIVRIINYFPSDLADFAVPRHKASEYDILSEIEDNDSESEESNGADAATKRKWEWRFGLILEDMIGSKTEEKATITAYVADKDAEFLLKLDAQNLRTNPQTLALLREKLFLLWGDLEEQKSKSPNANPPAPNSKPFPCCLMEYGIRTPRGADIPPAKGEDGVQEEGYGWDRRWRLWGTTIV